MPLKLNLLFALGILAATAVTAAQVGATPAPQPQPSPTFYQDPDPFPCDER